MNIHADKTQENKSKSVANEDSQKQSSGESTFQFVDNRPEIIAQRKLQEMANNSPQVKQAAQLQAMADNHFAQLRNPIQKKENNTGLPDNLKSGIENLSGYSMDDVRVHRNSDKPAQLQAHAYAQGTDIHLGPGQEKHLAHEAWHVVQQKQGRVKPTLQMKGKVNINDDAGLEKEANVMGAKVNTSINTFPTRSLSENLKGNISNKPNFQLAKIEFPSHLEIDPNPWSTNSDTATEFIQTLKAKPQALDIIIGTLEMLAKIRPLELDEINALNDAESIKQGAINSRKKESLEKSEPEKKGLLASKISPYLDSKSLLASRGVNKVWREIMMMEAQSRVPYPDKILFSMVNMDKFPPSFAKGNFTNAPINKGENRDFSWTQYMDTYNRKLPIALVGRIFDTAGIKSYDEKVGADFEKDQVIFTPATSGKWTPQIDDAWMLAHIHKGSTIIMVCDPANPHTFWDFRYKRPTATGREIILAFENGYHIFLNTGEYQGFKGGVVLMPPKKLKRKTNTGLLSIDLQEINISKILRFFPREIGAEQALTYNNERVGDIVSQEQDRSEKEQIHAINKNFEKLLQYYSSGNPNLEKQKNTCANLLTPDSHIVPFEKLSDFIGKIELQIIDKYKLEKLSSKWPKDKKQGFVDILLDIFKDARDKIS